MCHRSGNGKIREINEMELGIRFKRIIVRYLAHCLIVIVIAVAFTDVSQIYAQSTTDFNQLPDEAFEAGLIIGCIRNSTSWLSLRGCITK